MGQGNSEPPITHPIHESKGGTGEPTLPQVILHQDHGGDACRFPKKGFRVLRMVQDIHQEYHVDTPVTRRDPVPIESVDRNGSVGPNENIDATNGDVRSESNKGRRQPSIATAHVENPGAGWHERGEKGRKDGDSSARNPPLMQPLDPPHRRRMPRMLRKKLERNAWNPRTLSVIPGITQRMVRA